MIQRLGISEILLRLFALRDVLDRALVIQQFALGTAPSVAIFRNPNDALILPINLRLKPGNRIPLAHHPHKFIPPPFLHIQSLADIRDAIHQLLRRVVAVNPCQRHVRQQVTPSGVVWKIPSIR